MSDGKLPPDAGPLALQRIADLERRLSDSTTRIAALTSALSFAEGAIEDAIYTETGIDGDTGQRVLHIIREAMASGTFDQTSPPVEEPPTRRELVHYAEQLKRNVKTAVDDVVATFQDLQVEAGQDDDQATVAAIQEAAARAMRTAVLAALSIPSSNSEPVGQTGHPKGDSEGQPPHPAGEGYWLIFYEDADVRPEVFNGAGAEAAARARFAQASTNWNAHLFRLAESNVHDTKPDCGNGVGNADDARDAARYRWLRSEYVNTDPIFYDFWNTFGTKLCREDAMDKAIDREMRRPEAREAALQALHDIDAELPSQ